MRLIFSLAANIFIINNTSWLINNWDINNTISLNSQITDKNQQTQTFYFQNNHESLTLYSSYGAFYDHAVGFIQTWSFNDDINPVNFNNLLIINPSDCYTKTSWGSSTFYNGEPIYKAVTKLSYNQIVYNSKVVTNNDIKKYATIKLLDITDYYNRSCYIVAKQYAGFSWYYDHLKHQFFFQACYYFSTQIVGSLVGGGQWLNTGAGIYLY